MTVASFIASERTEGRVELDHLGRDVDGIRRTARALKSCGRSRRSSEILVAVAWRLTREPLPRRLPAHAERTADLRPSSAQRSRSCDRLPQSLFCCSDERSEMPKAFDGIGERPFPSGET
jgi:hypothetical protein